MTRSQAATLAFVLLAPTACMAQSSAQVANGNTAPVAVVAAPGQEVTFNAGLESAYVLQGSPGQAFLVIDLAAAAAQQQTQRPAMAVALVIDRSGSMSGEKIVHARAAASSFIHNMADGDVVSIYQYDDSVEQVAPPTTINANSRPGLISLVQGIAPRGSTNLYGGLVSGIESLTSAAAERPVRRVILISDGLANVGPSTPAEIGNAAAAGAARGISVTTIGVGLDYDAAVMTTVAVRAGGRFYHMQEPAQLASILETELNALSATVARGVILELVPTQGVQILGASGADLTRQGNTVQLSIGDMLGNQSRQIIVPMTVPTSGPAQQSVGNLRLSYRAAASGAERNAESQVAYQLASNQSQVDQAVQPQYAVAVETYRSAQARRQAAVLVSQGQNDRAAQVLQSRAQSARSRGAALGGAAQRQINFDADEVAGEVQAVRAATSAPARRARELELEDAAMTAEGY